MVFVARWDQLPGARQQATTKSPPHLPIIARFVPADTNGGAAVKQWIPANRKAVCKDGRTRSLYRCAASPGKLFVRRVSKATRTSPAVVKHVPFVPPKPADPKKKKRKAGK